MVKIENTVGKYKLQHYVPVFLLNKFGRKIKKDTFKIRGFDLIRSQPIKGITKDFCAKNYFYDRFDPKITELYLKDNETKTSKIVNKIIDNKSIQIVNPKELDILKEFSFFQIVRTMLMRNEYKRFVKEKYNLSNAESEDIAKKFQNSVITMENKYSIIHDKESKKIFIDYRNSFLKRFEKFDVLLMSIENPDKHIEFYLSDNPILLDQPKRKKDRNCNYDDDLMYFPLTPKLCLVFHDKNIQMYRFKKLLNIKNNLYPIYNDKRSIGDVQNYNIRALWNSFQFIFFKTGNIQDLKKILKDNPELRDVNRQRFKIR